MNDDFNDDFAKYDAMREELSKPDPDIPDSVHPPLLEREPSGNLGGEGRAYDPQQDGTPQTHHQHQPQQYEPQQHQQLPDVTEDPIGHFSGRFQELESVALGNIDDSARRDFVGNVERSERLIRQEVPDYDEACEHLEQGRIDELNKMFPDGNRQAEILAHQHGFQSAGQMKVALLNRDRVSVADWAVRNGQSPAEVYYRLAGERGYRPKVGITNTQRRALHGAIKTARGGDFDQAWDYYSKLHKFEDSRR